MQNPEGYAIILVLKGGKRKNFWHTGISPTIGSEEGMHDAWHGDPKAQSTKV